MVAVERVADVLGGRSVLKRPVKSWSDLEEAVREGLPKGSLQAMAKRALPTGEPASTLVYRVVPIATFKRRTRLDRGGECPHRAARARGRPGRVPLE